MTKLTALKAITPELASANILSFAREGRLEQHKWHGRGGDGREIACLLGSIDPNINSPQDCPAALMPEWLANLTVRLFDGVSRSRVLHYGEAYGLSVARWGAIDAEGWKRIRRNFVRALFESAIDAARTHQPEPPHAYWAETQALAARAGALFADETTTSEIYSAFAEEAQSLRNRLWTIRSEAWDAWREARAAASGVGGGTPALAVAEAAAAALAVAAEAAAAAAEAAAEAARTKSYEASFDLLLSTIESELNRAA